MSNMAVVVLGYNRPLSLRRLLESLNNANYDNDTLDLIISLDYSGTTDSRNVADEFVWMHGSKSIKIFTERQGLRKHVFTTGMLLMKYEAIAVLEDDIYLSPNYYIYMREAVSYYKNDSNIAGISLYTHLWNIFSDKPFLPANSNYDVFFLQYAQSWGQIWLRKQWFDFLEWYKKNEDKSLIDINVPSNLHYWPKSSWLKYHIKYCIDNNKYFVYPYISLSTNFTEKGEHNKSGESKFQVPLMYGRNKNYAFVEFSKFKEAVYYDSYFERQKIGATIGVQDELLCVDLYGKKNHEVYKKYLLSMKREKYLVLKSYGLALRPHEMNVLLKVGGSDIFLYDTTVITGKTPQSTSDTTKWQYYNKVTDSRYLFSILLSKINKKLIKKSK